MNVRFLSPAASELEDAINYYESEREGLGARFVSQVQESVKRIINFPESYQKIGKYSRRCLVLKFPYGVIYEYRKNEKEILVVAIANLHREPDYWFSRV